MFHNPKDLSHCIMALSLFLFSMMNRGSEQISKHCGTKGKISEKKSEEG